MLPREHGAYFQLAIPLLAAEFSQRPNVAGAALAASACLAFLAHEPLLILVGARGARRRADDAGRARAWFAVLAGGAGVLGVTGLALAPRGALGIAALAAAGIAGLVVLAARRSEHTLGGELIAAAALTGASAVVVAAGGATVATALQQWLGWAIGFGATVVAVHRVLARHKRPAAVVDRILAIVLAASSAALIATAWRYPTSAIAAPLVVLATAVVAFPPRATRLRAVGVAIVAVALVSAALALAA